MSLETEPLTNNDQKHLNVSCLQLEVEKTVSDVGLMNASFSNTEHFSDSRCRVKSRNCDDVIKSECSDNGKTMMSSRASAFSIASLLAPSSGSSGNQTTRSLQHRYDVSHQVFAAQQSPASPLRTTVDDSRSPSPLVG